MTRSTGPTNFELRNVAHIIEVVLGDLDASRGMLQRLLAIGDALLAVAFTALTVLAGLTLTNETPAIAIAGIPLVLLLGYIDAYHWVHFRRVSGRTRVLERLIDSHITVLREHGAARPQALEHFARAVDRYEFGVERALEPPGLSDVWNVNRDRPRLLLYVLIAVALGGCVVATW